MGKSKHPDPKAEQNGEVCNSSKDNEGGSKMKNKEAENVKDITQNLDKLSLDKKKGKRNTEDIDSDENNEVIVPKIGGAFAALMGDDMDDSDDMPLEEEVEKTPVIKETAKKESKEKPKKDKISKKSKRKGKNNDDDDDELEQLLAEIESEYSGNKKSKPEIKKELTPPISSTENKEKVDNVPVLTTTKTNQAAHDDLPSSKEAKKANKKKEKQESKSVTTNGDVPKKEPSPETTAPETKKKKKKTNKEEKEPAKEEEEETSTKKGKPNKKMIEAMKAMLEKKKEEEERLRRLEEEKIKQEEEMIRLVEEQKRIELERKEKLKEKQKEKKLRLKDEGKLLTAKQKLDQKRASEMLEALKAQGFSVPGTGDSQPVQKRVKKKKTDSAGKNEDSKEATPEPTVEVKSVPDIKEIKITEEDSVAEAWDAQDSDSEKEEISAESDVPTTDTKEPSVVSRTVDKKDNKEDDQHGTESERKRERALSRMEQRKIENEKNKSEKILRAPVVCVLGHVDHGKTKILDKLRRTDVQKGEVGGITQQIGATNVPFDAIKSQTRMIKDFQLDNADFPGLLIIDTPGHESFSNLRSRGSSLCDIAILVVDITQGLEPQTIESINLLKNKKTPFVVALNKVDRIFEWHQDPSKDVRDVIKLQSGPATMDFEKKTADVIQALNIQGLNAALFWENPDPRSYVSLVPTSAISGEGMGNLMSLIASMCQQRLTQRLMFTEELQCTVLEVKTIQGHGTTVDVILINGRLREGDSIILAGTEGPIVTQIRSLLVPKPMKEIRVKGQYDELKEVKAALGVKIAARDLDKAIAGLNLQVAHGEEEVEILLEMVDKEFKSAMRSIKVKDKGVYVQASTLGALEALLEYFKTNKVPYAGIRVGPVVKRDVMKAAAMLEHDPMYAVILAFDVKVERDAQDLADREGIKIFSEETIYHLGDRYVEYLNDYKKKKQEENRHIAVFPTKLKIVPSAIFNKRDPIVLGVTVEAGILRRGTLLCVPSKEFVEIGVVTSLEFDNKVVEIAKKGVTVCMKVEPIPGHSPKLFGRHFDADDLIVSKISRESIDACKQFFRDDLGKNEWKLMAELKKQFGIL